MTTSPTPPPLPSRPPTTSTSSDAFPSASSSSSSATLLPFSSGLIVDFVLLAEFDILAGSQVRHQYPRPTGVKEAVLAESMLPEGAHSRESDWTVFFLTDRMVRAAQRDKEETARKERERAERKAQREREQQHQPAAHPDTVQADGSPQSSPSPPPSAHAAASTPPPSSESSSASVPAPGSESDDGDDAFFCVLNLCRTKYDKGVKRGAIVKSLAIVTRYRWYNVFKPLLMLALDAIFDAAPIAPSSTLSPASGSPSPPPHAALPASGAGEDGVLAVMTELYAVINSMSLPLEVTRGMNETEQALAIASTTPSPLSSSPSIALTVQFMSTSFPMRIPLHLLPSEVLESSLTSLLSRFGPHTLDIYTALLSSRRVIFLAYQQPAASVCSTVLSSLLLISPPFPSLLHRAFPYTSLTSMDFLDTPGYVAGVTNPIFQQRSQWWDVLCDVSDGTVTFSPQYGEELRGTGGSASDAAFWTELNYGLQHKYGEEWLRCMFRDYTDHILSLVHDTAVFPDLTTRAQQLEAQQARINAILRSPTYTTWMQRKAQTVLAAPTAWSDISRLITHHVLTLRARTPSTAQLLSILSDLNTLLFPPSPAPSLLPQLLALLPETQGGLMPLAVYVLHRDETVRREVVRLLRRVDADDDGRRWMGGLNYFLLYSYYREGGRDDDSHHGGAAAGAGAARHAANGPVVAVGGGADSDATTGDSVSHSHSASISGVAAAMEQGER